MAVELSFTDLDLTDPVRNFLLAILPDGVDAVLGQDNRVPEPLADDFVVMTLMGMTRLATDVDAWDPTEGASTMTSTASGQYQVQLDIHGDNSAANATRVWMAWRSAWACAFLKDTIITPLYADDPRQSGFSNGEDQLENRWTVPVYFQAKPVLTMPQDYATSLAIQTYEADK